MAWVAHVRVDSAVGAVRSSPLLRCLVDLNVLDQQVVGVESLSISVGFGILEQAKEEFGGLDWVPGFRNAKVLACESIVSAILLACVPNAVAPVLPVTIASHDCVHTLCASTSASSVSSHGDSLLQFLHILEVLEGAIQLPAIDSLCGFSGVLEGYSKVGATALCRLCGRDSVLGTVSNLSNVSWVLESDSHFIYHFDVFGVVGL